MDTSRLKWRSYRGHRRTFVCTREIEGAEAEQTLTLGLKDFTSDDGSPTSWAEIDQLGLCAHFAAKGTSTDQVPLWQGDAPKFLQLAWNESP